MQRRGGGRGLGAVLFTDIVGSTAIAAEMGNTRWSELVARHHRIVRRELARFGGHEMDTAGDGFFATFERPADAIRCAVSITDAVRELGIEIRAGVSFGELESVGKKASGLVVNTASRVMSVAGSGEVLVPASVREITTGSGISFADHGIHQLKGLDGEFRLFKVVEVDGATSPPPLEEAEAAGRRNEIFPTGSSKRRALYLGIGVGVLALLVAGALLLTGSDPGTPASAAGGHRDSVAPFDVDRHRVGTEIPLDIGGRTGEFLTFVEKPIAVGEGSVWVLRQPYIIAVDPRNGNVRSEQFDVGYANSQTVETGFDNAWVLSGITVFKVHPGTGDGEPFVTLPAPTGLITWSLALGGDAIWTAESDGTLIRSDPFTGARDQSETGLEVDVLATTSGRLWASDILEAAVFEIDTESMIPTGRPIPIGGSIDLLIGRGDRLWALDRQLGTVTRVNVSTRVTQSTRVGDEATGMAVASDAVWVGDLAGSLYRIDAETLDVERSDIGSEVLGVAVDPADDDSVWLYLGREIE